MPRTIIPVKTTKKLIAINPTPAKRVPSGRDVVGSGLLLLLLLLLFGGTLEEFAVRNKIRPALPKTMPVINIQMPIERYVRVRGV